MNEAIQTTATGVTEKFLDLLTADVLWALLAIVLGAAFGVLVAEYAKRFKRQFHTMLSSREYALRAQFYSTFAGGICANALVLLNVNATASAHAVLGVIVFFSSAMLSPVLYDFVRRVFPAVESRVLKKIRGE